jgi:hypothetical protein
MDRRRGSGCPSTVKRSKGAKTLCERLLSQASPLGLYAEELDPVSGRHLGNFPQAFTTWPSSTRSCSSFARK